MQEPPILFTIEENIAWMVLNRPERRNAINQSMLIHLYDAFEEVMANPDIRVGIVTGNGKSFCSGLDLDAFEKEDLFNPRGDGRDFPDIMKNFHKPLVGAINGHAITGGLEMALNFDFLIASDRAAFADTHSRKGIHPGWGMTQLLQEAIGRRRAVQMSYTCQMINAEIACRWGMVNEVVPHEMLISRVREIALEICRSDPDMLQTIRRLISYREKSSLEQALANERKGFLAFMGDRIENYNPRR